MHKYILILFFLCSFNSLKAETARPIDEQAWEEIVQGRTYTEASDEPVDWETPEWESPEPVPTTLKKIIAYVLAALVLLVLIWLLFKYRSSGSGKKVPVVASGGMRELDESPMETDLDKWLAFARQQQDRRLLFRIHYLILIKALHDRHHIVWRKEKTNHDYLKETAGLPFAPVLNTYSLLFDRIWYGLRVPKENEMNQYSEEMRELEKVILGQ